MIGSTAVEQLLAEADLDAAAVYLRNVDGAGPGVALDDGRFIYPASMIKTPLALAAACAEERGDLRWEDRIEVDACNMTLNDAPSPMKPGYVTTVAELVELMLQCSDNVATNVLIDVLGRERASADLAALGFPDTVIRRKLSGGLPLVDDPQATGRNTHPARDAAGVFARIANGSVPGAERLEAILHGQYWNGKLSRGLGEGDRFAHKTGDTDDVSHDGGILTPAGGARYVIVVYTELPSSDANDERFGAFMRILRPHL